MSLPWRSQSLFVSVLFLALATAMPIGLHAQVPATTTTVVSSSPTSVFGQAVTFTATVSVVPPGSGTPTGTVTFRVDGVDNGTIFLSGGTAALIVSSLTVGTHSIVAVYNGSGSYAGSTSSTLTQTVNKASTTTSVSASANPSVSGQAVTFTATVGAVAPGAGTPTGTVTFTVDGVPQTPVALSGGQAAFSPSLSVGPHSITAAYNGSGSFNTSTSSTLTQTVNKASTTTSVSASANPSVSGQTVTFTATVGAVAPGAGTPTGTVTFTIDGLAQAPVALSGGQAAFSSSSLSVGAHSITAAYNGGSSFNTSTSSTLTQTVNKANTTTSVGASANPSVSGQTVTFTATVGAVAPGAGTPTGTVTFTVDGATQTPIALGGGQAAFSTSLLSVGTHSITAAYNGGSSFNTSTSSTLTQTVSNASTTTSVSASANPSVFGQTVTFTATVGAVAPGAGTPTGTVTFTVDGATQTPIALGGGQAAFSTSLLSVGTHSITAAYNGGSSFTTSTSPALAMQVSLASPTNLVATAVSTSQVNLTWGAVNGGTGYDVFRVLSSGSLQYVSSAAGPSFSHTGLAAGTTYVYAVRATNGSTVGPTSSPDLATTVFFTDDPLAAGVTWIKAVHVNELRTAIDAVRSAAGLSPAVYSRAIASGEPIWAVDMTGLRAALDSARATLGVPALTYTDSLLNAGNTIKAAHLQELRDGVE